MKQKMRVNDYLLLYGGFVIYSLVSVLAKQAAAQDNLLWASIYMIGEIFTLGIYAVIWQQVLKIFPLMVAMSSKGITVVLSLIWSICLFREEITIFNIIGAAVIVFGIWMVSSDE